MPFDPDPAVPGLLDLLAEPAVAVPPVGIDTPVGDRAARKDGASTARGWVEVELAVPSR